MKLEEFGKWLESWVKERKGTIIKTGDFFDDFSLSSVPEPQAEHPKLVILVPDAPYNPYDDMEWLTISWGLIR
jgi:hypothetical protein